MKNPTEILSIYFGHQEFKPAQKEIIDLILDKKNVLALLPTGGGKSLCFQIPALAQKGICIVVSPLIALMQNQVNTLKKHGIKAMLLEGGTPFKELDTLLDNCIYGNYKFLYLSPERLQQEIVLARIEQMNVNLIAIDEAHCISQWGHDFRPAYRKIPILRKIKPETTWIALTATATNRVMDDIVSLLEMDPVRIVKKSFERKNISFQTLEADDKKFYLTEILRKNPGSSIVYVRNRKESVELSNYLNSKGFVSKAYHAGIASEEKKVRLRQWLKEEIWIMVATNAFGMGIDKPNVRSVIHYHFPESPESYFQEAGRGGRDGKPAVATILFNKNDEERVKNQFVSVLPTIADVKQVYRKLQSFFSVAYGEGENLQYDFNFSEFCGTYLLNPRKTHNVLRLLDRTNILSLSQQYQQKIELQINVPNQQLLYFLDSNKKYELLIKTLLRTYPGLFDHLTRINLFLIRSKINLPEQSILSFLKELKHEEIILFEMTKHDAAITFLVPREDDVTINPLSGYIEQQHKQKLREIKAVLEYVTYSNRCKNSQLLTYFGEKGHQDCGICSFCIERKTNEKSTKKIKSKKENLRQAIFEILENESLSSRDLISRLNFSREETLEMLRFLLETNKIKLSTSNTYYI
ncbi:MAG TPA: RecQ family ATP-dependent DNA helicase [Flavobacteriaceae bacterium]|nr:RecQ family ATP-dependent DNA helicase [Flavobacteriaceae bacterium]